MQAFKSIFLQSDIGSDRIFVNDQAVSAAEGYNSLLGHMDCDVAVLCHQDVYLPEGWTKTLRKRLGELPKDWMVAGFFGIDQLGAYCGKIHDRRIPKPMITDHKLPQKALSVDGCVMAIKPDLRISEELVGFDLYDVYLSCHARSLGGSVWIVDNMPEHYPTRRWDWQPDTLFLRNWEWLKKRFPKERIISTCYR
jgi:hypothetical protein